MTELVIIPWYYLLTHSHALCRSVSVKVMLAVSRLYSTLPGQLNDFQTPIFMEFMELSAQ